MCKYIYLLEVGNAEKIFVVVLTGILHLWEHEDVGDVSMRMHVICGLHEHMCLKIGAPTDDLH